MGIKSKLLKTELGIYLKKQKDKLDRKTSAKEQFKRAEKRYLQYSSTDINRDRERYLRLRIIVESHVIEKGLSHNHLRAGFGKDRVEDLCNKVEEYTQMPTYDKFVVENALQLIIKYHDMNKKLNYDDSAYVKKSILNVNHVSKSIDNGVKNYNLSNVFEIINKSNFSRFAQSRSSVRIYDYKCEKINRQVILECIRIAQTAPNACNRQAVRVHIVSNSEYFEEIERLQLGCKGFGKNVSLFAFISVDIGLYECSETELPCFDAGLFTMNLIYALHEKGLFSCVLNASFPGKADRRIREIANVSENEEIKGLLAVYKVDFTKSIKVPVSARRSAEDITFFI